MAGALAAIAVFVAVWLLVARALRQRGLDPEAALLRNCYGDREQANRLIDGELRRTPGTSRAEATVRALERRKLDNR